MTEIKKIIIEAQEYFNKNVFIKYMIVSIWAFSLLFYVEKNIFSLLSLPWWISYLITSLWNWQFDQNIFKDIFNVTNGIDKIRLLNLFILWIYYLVILYLIDVNFNIFKNNNFKNKKKILIITILNFL